LSKGVEEKTNYAYLGFGELVERCRRKDRQIDTLRVTTFSSTRGLKYRARVVDTHKKLLLLVGSQNIPRLQVVVGRLMARNASAESILNVVKQAALGVYKPKGYLEEEKLLGFLMMKVGGAKVAKIASAGFSGPSVSTLRRFHIADPLVASAGDPSYHDVVANIKASFSTTGTFAFDSAAAKQLGYVLMIDEVKCELRLRWDASTNRIIGLCREHSNQLSTEFNTLEDLETVYGALQRGDVHRVTEVRALPVLSSYCC
jgi:hypothetical protein